VVGVGQAVERLRSDPVGKQGSSLIDRKECFSCILYTHTVLGFPFPAEKGFLPWDPFKITERISVLKTGGKSAVNQKPASGVLNSPRRTYPHSLTICSASHVPPRTSCLKIMQFSLIVFSSAVLKRTGRDLIEEICHEELRREKRTDRIATGVMCDVGARGGSGR